MEQLSSCYFCGGALDASLDEYPVVPKALHPTTDDQKTVVLCQGCRQKLGTVVETIVAVVENPESVQTSDDSARAAGGESASGAAGVDEGWGDAGEPSTSDAGGQSDVGEPPATGEADASVDDDTDDTDDTDDAGSESVTYTTSTAAGGRKSVSGNPESIRDEGRGGTGGENASTNGGETASGGADADEEAAADEGSDDDGPSMTALENTKVMRLLQNREFPVDREEIRTVAVNAYDISESQFDAVVDAAVDRGLIGEESGRFVEAE